MRVAGSRHPGGSENRRSNRTLQRRQVVTTFEVVDESPGWRRRGNCQGHLPVIAFDEVKVGQRISRMGVVSGTDEYPIGLELREYRDDQVHRSTVHIPGSARWEGKIDVGAS